MNKTLIGFFIGLVLSSFFFLIKDFLTSETAIPKKHVTVRLQNESTKKINKITLAASHSSQTIDLKGQHETLFVFPNPGEGEFYVCCQFEDAQELCSTREYVEAGYSHLLKIKDTEIEIVRGY